MATKYTSDHYALGCAPALRFLWSQILCRLYKSPLDETINRGPPCVYVWKKSTYTWWHDMSQFGGPRKQQNNPACTKHVSIFKMLKLDTIQRKKKKKTVELEGQPVLGLESELNHHYFCLGEGRQIVIHCGLYSLCTFSQYNPSSTSTNLLITILLVMKSFAYSHHGHNIFIHTFNTSSRKQYCVRQTCAWWVKQIKSKGTSLVLSLHRSIIKLLYIILSIHSVLDLGSATRNLDATKINYWGQGRIEAQYNHIKSRPP